MKRIETEPDKKRNGGKTVLIVDDNPAIRRAISDAFLSDGFSVCGEAADGQEAINVAKQFTPDLIILDLSMPVMNGLQAAPELRKIAPKTLIILYTMYRNELVADQASKIGIDLVLSKTKSLSSVVDEAHSLMAD